MTPDQNDQESASSVTGPFAIGDTFEGDFAFTAANITQTATLLGDMNPVHHTASPAYGSVIACGAHIAGLMMSLGAARITERSPSLGRTWNFRFRAPVLAGDQMHVVIRITAIDPHRRGPMISFAGEGTVERDGARIVVATTDGTAILLESHEAAH
ncbi:MAG: MaoC family dehydratase [Thermomicrobiales bacterium]